MRRRSRTRAASSARQNAAALEAVVHPTYGELLVCEQCVKAYKKIHGLRESSRKTRGENSRASAHTVSRAATSYPICRLAWVPWLALGAEAPRTGTWHPQRRSGARSERIQPSLTWALRVGLRGGSRCWPPPPLGCQRVCAARPRSGGDAGCQKSGLPLLSRIGGLLRSAESMFGRVRSGMRYRFLLASHKFGSDPAPSALPTLRSPLGYPSELACVRGRQGPSMWHAHAWLSNSPSGSEIRSPSGRPVWPN